MSKKALDLLCEHFGDKVLQTHEFRGDETAIIEADTLVEAARWLRDHPTLKFDMLTDLTAVDYLPREPRFEVVYHFYSMANKMRLRLKVQLPGDDENPALDTLCELYRVANWLEREIWDMYGITFAGHPEMRRILMYEEFVGHPLRKDYPKEKRQPLIRRPENEIAHAMERRGKARPLTPIVPPDSE